MMMLTSLTYHYTREYLNSTNESCSVKVCMSPHVSDSLPAEADFIVVSVLGEEVEVNIVSALGQQSLQILRRANVR
mgnify:CR=1 FL=1